MHKETDSTAHHDDVDDFEIENFETNDDPNYSFGYQMGFDAGYIEGYSEGQSCLAIEKESVIYNTCLDNILEQIKKFELDIKEDVITVLQSLRRV